MPTRNTGSGKELVLDILLDSNDIVHSIERLGISISNYLPGVILEESKFTFSRLNGRVVKTIDAGRVIIPLFYVGLSDDYIEDVIAGIVFDDNAKIRYVELYNNIWIEYRSGDRWIFFRLTPPSYNAMLTLLVNDPNTKFFQETVKFMGETVESFIDAVSVARKSYYPLLRDLKRSEDETKTYWFSPGYRVEVFIDDYEKNISMSFVHYNFTGRKWIYYGINNTYAATRKHFLDILEKHNISAEDYALVYEKGKRLLSRFKHLLLQSYLLTRIL